MEMFAIILAVPVAFVATALYALAMRRVLRARLLNRPALWISVAVLVGLVVEWGALLTIGTLQSRAIVGSAFYFLHSALFFLAIPALASVLIIERSDRTFGSWFMVALMCSIFALPVVLTQYTVAEALYGVDGKGGPYGDAPTIPMPAGW